MADNESFRSALVGIDHQRNVSAVYTARVYGLTRQDFIDSLDFYHGGDEDIYEGVVELWDDVEADSVQQ